jgi:hypothetical protein
MDLQQILDIIEDEYITDIEALENILEFSLNEYSEREVVVSKLKEQKEKLNFNYFAKKIEEENILTYDILEKRFAGFNFENKSFYLALKNKISRNKVKKLNELLLKNKKIDNEIYSLLFADTGDENADEIIIKVVRNGN